MEAPYLTRISLKDTGYPTEEYPYNLPIIRNRNLDITIEKPVLIVAGDNGTGKSTLLENIADFCGFNINGGNRDHLYEGNETFGDLNDILRYTWRKKTHNGFFMRAESFQLFADYIDGQAGEFGERVYGYYGGKSLNQQSHGEAFLSLFRHRFHSSGLYILDEPEAALSPNKILSLMVILKDLSDTGNQFIIATHSPILMAYPYAQFRYIVDGGIIEMEYTQTEHYQITRSFLDDPERYLRYLFEE